MDGKIVDRAFDRFNHIGLIEIVLKGVGIAMNIGLTGGIATGKSTVSAMLVDYGALLVDTDSIAREVVTPGHPVLERVVQRFGQDVLNDDGTLNREKLGQRVFHDPSERKELERIMHPAIRKIMLERMKKLEAEHPDRLVIVDVPLLFESGLEHFFEEIVVVYASEQDQIDRMMNNRGMTKEHAEARLKAQLPIEVKKEKADVVIDNSGTLDETKLQIEKYLREKGFIIK